MQNDSVSQTQKIFEELNQFIKKNKEISVDLDEKPLEQIQHDFFKYLVDGSVEESEENVFSAFIIKSKNNKAFIQHIDSMRVGNILYLGLKTSNQFDRMSTWNVPLVIYLDMEILFHLYGFNGKIFKLLADEFFELVRQINSKMRHVKLRFFKETKNEIENFFDAAESNYMKNKIINPNATAMHSILKGCKSNSDIRDKESDFFKFLKDKIILLDDFQDSYYDEKYQKYNLENIEIVETYSATEEEKEQNESRLKLVNHINVLRKGKYFTNYKECQFILMTETKKTLQMAQHFINEIDDNHNPKYVPCAVNLSVLTNIFWFYLNGVLKKSNKFPMTVESVIKAQVVLSSAIGRHIDRLYEKTKEEFKKGKITREIYIERILNYRNKKNIPEFITQDNIDSNYKFIKEDELSIYEEEKKFLKTENKELKNKLNKVTIDLQNKENQLKLAQYKNQLNTLEGTKRMIDFKIEKAKFFKKIQNLVKIVFMIIIFVVIFLAVYVLIYAPDKIELINTYYAFLVCIVTTICFFCFNIFKKKIKKYALVNYISRFIVKNILYRKIPDESIDDLINDSTKTENQIKEIKDLIKQIH